MKTSRFAVISLLVCASITLAQRPITTADILQYSTQVLLSDIVALLRESETDPEKQEMFAEHYYGVLYALWYTSKTESPIPREDLDSYFRAFNKFSKKYDMRSIIDFDDPLGINSLTPSEVTEALESSHFARYWDWMISKNADKAHYAECVSEFRLELQRRTPDTEQGAAANP